MAQEPEQKFTVKIFSPFQVFYEGEAVSVSAKNKTGEFDVLAHHGSFFTLVLPGIVKVNTGFEKLDIEIANGIMRVSNNVLTIFANV